MELWIQYQRGSSPSTRAVSGLEGLPGVAQDSREKGIGRRDGRQHLAVVGYKGAADGTCEIKTGFSLKQEKPQHVCVFLGIIQEKQEVLTSEKTVTRVTP